MFFNYKTIMENLKSTMKCHLSSKMGAISKIMTFLLKYMMDFGFLGKRIQKTLLHSLFVCLCRPWILHPVWIIQPFGIYWI